MAAPKAQSPYALQSSPPAAEGDWYSAIRQAKRDVFRRDWALSILTEESLRPMSHSPARVRRARRLLAILQQDPPK